MTKSTAINRLYELSLRLKNEMAKVTARSDKKLAENKKAA